LSKGDATMAMISSSRIVLFAAGLIAMGAVGFSVWRTQIVPLPAPPPVAASEGQPTDPAAAITQIEAALKANPKDARGWRVLGGAHREAGNYAESAMALRRATALEPDNAEGWALLGEALALASPPPMSPEARGALKKAQAIDKNEPLSAYYLAAARDMDGDHQGAIEDWFALLDRSPAGAPWIPEVRGAIARVAAANKIDVAKRLAAANGASAQTAPAPPNNAVVRQMVEGLAKKLAADPKNIDGWIMLMRSRVTLGETAQATQALASAKAANPESAAKLDQAARELGL
jgi:cytochrome c-type biogenesis protein CcmH